MLASTYCSLSLSNKTPTPNDLSYINSPCSLVLQMVIWFLYCIIANNKVNISVLLADPQFSEGKDLVFVSLPLPSAAPVSREISSSSPVKTML